MNPGIADFSPARGRCAVVSIGTNSTRLLIADIQHESAKIVVQRSIGTRIGEGLGNHGSLAEEPMHRTLVAIARLRRIAGSRVRTFGIATSALRRATNGAEFLRRAQSSLGAPIEVLSGEAEAQASYRGAVHALGPGGRTGVVDVGGGSTEYAAGTGPAPDSSLSCEIGAVRLTEAVPELAGSNGPASAEAVAKAQRFAREALQPIAAVPAVERVALVGGTATTAAAIVAGRVRVSAEPLKQADLHRLIETLASLDLADRKRLRGMRPQRADIMAAGVIVLEAALKASGSDTAVATTSDLLLGFLLSRREGAA